MRLAHASAVVGGFTVFSRITGFVRDVLIAAVVGAGPLADALLVAMKLPNLLRRLFADGAFASAFVPVYGRALQRDGESAARAVAEDTLALLVPLLIAVVALFQLAMPVVVLVLAPGFAGDPTRYDAALAMARVTFPFLLLVGVAALVGGMLNARGRFAAAAFVPVLMNLVLTAALLIPWPSPEIAARAVAWGVPIAGVLQLAWLWAALRADGVALRPRRPRLTPETRELGRLCLPLMLSAATYQVNVLVNTIFASTLAAGAVSALYFADRLCQLPMGVIGVALGTALLPYLTQALHGGREDAAREAQNRAIEAAALLTLPAATGLVVLSLPIVRMLFERGAFDADASAVTAAAVAVFAAGLPAQVLVRVLGPAFYARADGRTPLRLALTAVATNLVLTALLIGPLGHVGIALANALAGWLNAVLHLVVLARRGQWRPDARLLDRLPRILMATALMAGALELVEGYGTILAIAAGGAVFAAAALALGASRPVELRALVRRSPA